MKYLPLIVLVTALAGLGLGLQSHAHSSQADAQSKSETRRADVERGRYIVHHVAMCVQCHSPRDAHGQLVEGKLLHGEALPVASPFKDMRWAFRAPHIAGLPGYTKEQAERLLTTGIAANGTAPLAPMPPFRMTKDDAADVIAYLMSAE
jgi:mono/diheme cytochrome c family protein